ncbi:SET domain-containing protein [Armillaria gallica]|uniref:SET domain-containing protein n=1 Tax=Armillaria gallica TaxID=47427 RepID=A0A2H3CND0_ARMGA|nr:SET domain-containing protein [Armillaria gallica]
MHIVLGIPDCRPQDVCYDCPGETCASNPECTCKEKQALYGIGAGLNKFLYNEDGLLQDFEGIPIFECHDGCLCNDTCQNWVVQHHRQCYIKIAKAEKKGWGIFSSGHEILVKGTFIGTYSGQYISEAENGSAFMIAISRSGEGSYIFDLNFYHLKGMEMLSYQCRKDWQCKTLQLRHDLTWLQNHACNPNCHIEACYVEEGNLTKPLVIIFADKEIHQDEELIILYFGGIQV